MMDQGLNFLIWPDLDGDCCVEPQRHRDHEGIALGGAE